MKIIEAVEFIKEKNCVAVAIDYSEKEIFIVQYDPDPENFADVIVYIAGNGGEGLISVEEFLECQAYSNLDFLCMKEDGMDALYLEFPYALKTIKRNLIS